MHVGIVNPWWRGKRSQHSRRMRNRQFYITGKRPIPLRQGQQRGKCIRVLTSSYTKYLQVSPAKFFGYQQILNNLIWSNEVVLNGNTILRNRTVVHCVLTHRAQVTHVCIIDSLTPERCIKIKEYWRFNENFCQHILYIFCEIAQGWMPIISNQHWFR